MGLFTFILYLLIFVEILLLEEYTDREYRGTELVSGIGIILTLLLWVCDAFGTLELVFIVFQWATFGYFTWRHFRFFFQWREVCKA